MRDYRPRVPEGFCVPEFWISDPMRFDTPPCKHGEHVCQRCGTTERQDATHTTVDGVGVVGRLRRRR